MSLLVIVPAGWSAVVKTASMYDFFDDFTALFFFLIGLESFQVSFYEAVFFFFFFWTGLALLAKALAATAVNLERRLLDERVVRVAVIAIKADTVATLKMGCDYKLCDYKL